MPEPSRPDPYSWVWTRAIRQQSEDDPPPTPELQAWVRTYGGKLPTYPRLHPSEREEIKQLLITESGDIRVRQLLVLLARNPKSLLQLLRDTPSSQEPNVFEFRALVALADIGWQLAYEGHYPADSFRLLRSRLARIRFLLLSICFRDSGNSADYDANWRDSCREAQQIWLECLDATESDPWLSERDGQHNEQDAWYLVFRKNIDGGVEMLFTATADGNWRRTLHDSGIARRVVDGHLLPRGALCAVLALSIAHERRTVNLTGPGNNRFVRVRNSLIICGNWLMLVAPVVAAVLTLGLLLVPWRDPAHRSVLAMFPAVGCLVVTTVIGLATGRHNAIRSRLTLARIPASVIIGLATLMALNPHWWHSTKGSTLVRVTAIAMLLAAAVAYQAHELRGHGVTGWTLICRTSGIVGIGLCYAFVICYATLRVIAPLVTEDGDKLAGWWLHDPGAYHGAAPWWILGLATAWSYTVGVFVQVVWDDRPITAPLGRMPRGSQ